MTWYQAAAEQPNFIRGEVQARAIEYLGRLWTELVMFKRRRNRFLGRNLRSPQIPKGLYFYDSVGRGKSFLVDAFFGCLPYHRKRRVHFHAFMAEIHQWLEALEGEADPLKAAAAEITKETCVLCFDEFHVNDIADAMILGRLLENLLSEDIVLVATSNYAPSKLYPQDQNRSSSLPAVVLIESNLTVLNIDGGEDCRLRTLRPAEIFFMSNSEKNGQKLAALFKEMSGVSELNPGISIIRGRRIPHKTQSERTIWFDFRALCFGPRSQADCLYLAEHYEMVFLSGLEHLTPQEKAGARHLIWLIDVLYGFRAKLCVTSAVDINDIYVEGDFAGEFTRTANRMIEMQSEVYLERPHLTLNEQCLSQKRARFGKVHSPRLWVTTTYLSIKTRT